MFAAGGTHNPMKDYEVQQPPADSISKVAFSPNANYLIASSWDNNVSAVGRQGGGSLAPNIALAKRALFGVVLRQWAIPFTPPTVSRPP